VRAPGSAAQKKSLSPAEQTREDVAAARAAWREAAAQLTPEDFVFVDESGVATDLTRTHGRAPRGERARGAVPYGRWHRLTILGGLSLSGLVACMTVEGATDTAVMVAFTQHVLVPVLRPGQVVVLDNLAPHKAPRVRALIEAAGCRLLLLPPYSPDLNPIEQAWSKLKALLRGLGARTVDALNTALATLVHAVTAADAQAYFRHCGYAR
jgi:transposase